MQTTKLVICAECKESPVRLAHQMPYCRVCYSKIYNRPVENIQYGQTDRSDSSTQLPSVFVRSRTVSLTGTADPSYLSERKQIEVLQELVADLERQKQDLFRQLIDSREELATLTQDYDSAVEKLEQDYLAKLKELRENALTYQQQHTETLRDLHANYQQQHLESSEQKAKDTLEQVKSVKKQIESANRGEKKPGNATRLPKPKAGGRS